MKIRFDRTVRVLYIEFERGEYGFSVEEKAEILHSETGRLSALLVRLRGVKEEFPDVKMDHIASECAASGWRLSDVDGEPFIFYEFKPLRTPALKIDWDANVDVDSTRKKIIGIEIDLNGAARIVRPGFAPRLRLHLPW